MVISTKWIKDITVKNKTLKLVEKKKNKHEGTCSNISSGKNFLSRTPVTQEKRAVVELTNQPLDVKASVCQKQQC